MPDLMALPFPFLGSFITIIPIEFNKFNEPSVLALFTAISSAPGNKVFSLSITLQIVDASLNTGIIIVRSFRISDRLCIYLECLTFNKGFNMTKCSKSISFCLIFILSGCSASVSNPKAIEDLKEKKEVLESSAKEKITELATKSKDMAMEKSKDFIKGQITEVSANSKECSDTLSKLKADMAENKNFINGMDETSFKEMSSKLSKDCKIDIPTSISDKVPEQLQTLMDKETPDDNDFYKLNQAQQDQINSNPEQN